ncbi:aldehyde dehydrogenase family protein [Candidatus Poribacteria bacterium]|jgi:alpha-ketoglutaric semialdehyde dehydrogenase|nr:aldehyde dehydrogenase family protein [Candidatus Poribacteria bacterium]MBT7096866.1 aldehyde dehydrogenase family protein [Candidatus Poribacteria bacterium]MBT7805813.1 aldehyde dehydrogenase family protein [Candidatus Poribacteria bacterium]
MATDYLNLIGGEWVPAASGKTFENINPADTSEVVGVHPESGREDVVAAIDAAEAAFAEWRGMGGPARGKILFKAAHILEARAAEVGRDLTREEGKTVPEGTGETLRTVELLEYYGGEARRITGETFPSGQPDTFLYTVKEPLGVVGLITPWNFPIAIPAWKALPALVAGNTVVLKPASLSPISSYHFVNALVEAGLPAGVLNMVTGPGGAVGAEIATNPRIKAVSFTGSNATGTGLYDTVTGRNAKCQCEMGGKNPVIVLADADLDKAVAQVIAGAILSTGQKCTATSRVLVEQAVADEFTDLLVEKVNAMEVGNGQREGVQVGPAVDQQQLDNILSYIEVGKSEGAEVLAGGTRLTGGEYDKGFYVEPTVFGGMTRSMRIAQEEIFGPVVGVIPVASFEEAMDIANDVEFGLSASIITRDLNRTFEYINGIQAGLVHVNAQTAGAEVQVPFGGYKGSSTGTREQGNVAVDFFTQIKTVYLHFDG